MNREETKRCPYCDELIRVNAVKCRYCNSMLSDSPGTPSGSMDMTSMVKQALAGKYEVLEIIGKGGMATVYKAKNKSLNKVVALKVIHPNLVHDEEFIKRFYREAQLGATLSHPNIVQIYDVSSIGGVHYLAMEYLEGEDMQSIIREKGNLTSQQTVKIISSIALALDYAHKKDIIHRDVKSSNILITNEGRAVLTDFGIAHAATGTVLTQAGTVIGTPEYMSPEQAQGKGVDNRSDIWSLGIVMYECLSGKVPFKGDNPLTTIHQLVNNEYPDIGKLKSGIPTWLTSIVYACLEKDPKERIQSGKELAEALKNKTTYEISSYKKTEPTSKQQTTKLKEEELKQPPVGKKKQKSRVLLLSIIGIAIVVLISLYIYLSGNRKEDQLAQQETQPIEQVSELPEPAVEEYIFVPSVTGKTLEEAKALLKDAGFKIIVSDVEESEQAKDGKVLRQEPIASTRCRASETEIKLVVGKYIASPAIQQPVTSNQRRETRDEQPVTRVEQPVTRIEQPTTPSIPPAIQQLLDNMVYVSDGTFTMGCTSEQGSDCDDDEQPTHQVTVSSFYMGKYEVTQAQWHAVMGSNPSRFSGCDNCPVENVSWNDVQDFIRKLNIITGKNFRLPTEAEWEFAARGGNSSRGYKYSGSNTIGSVGWYKDNSGSKTHAVGNLSPNELGLYDMSGNVYEWCNDWYGDYSSSSLTNPGGPSSGSDRVGRGGSWFSGAGNCRVSNRSGNYPGYRIILLGFRLVSLR